MAIFKKRKKIFNGGKFDKERSQAQHRIVMHLINQLMEDYFSMLS